MSVIEAGRGGRKQGNLENRSLCPKLLEPFARCTKEEINKLHTVKTFLHELKTDQPDPNSAN